MKQGVDKLSEELDPLIKSQQREIKKLNMSNILHHITLSH